jgi:hypothetical protein
MVLARLQEELIAKVGEIQRSHHLVTKELMEDLEVLLPK